MEARTPHDIHFSFPQYGSNAAMDTAVTPYP